MIDSGQLVTIYNDLKEIIFSVGSEEKRKTFADIINVFFKYSPPESNVSELISSLNNVRANALYKEFEEHDLLKYLE